jgi:hypothetical protein
MIARMSGYDHTQKSPLWLILLAAGLATWAGPWLSNAPAPVWVMLLTVGMIFMLCAFAFKHLRVADEGEVLAVRFGPLPIFRKRIAYAAMTGATAGRSTILDGWGIHYMPGLGWIYNLWGFGCVAIHMGGKTIRIGTDDPQGLAGFLTRKIAEQSAKQGR